MVSFKRLLDPVAVEGRLDGSRLGLDVPDDVFMGGGGAAGLDLGWGLADPMCWVLGAVESTGWDSRCSCC